MENLSSRWRFRTDMSSVRSASGTAYLIFQKLQMKECTRVRSNTTPEVEWTEEDSKIREIEWRNPFGFFFLPPCRRSSSNCIRLSQPYTTKSISLVGVAASVAKEPNKSRRFTLSFYIFYSRNPLISLIRDKIVLQLQLITPGSVSITVCRKCSISSLDEATACTCSLSLPVTR